MVSAIVQQGATRGAWSRSTGGHISTLSRPVRCPHRHPVHVERLTVLAVLVLIVIDVEAD